MRGLFAVACRAKLARNWLGARKVGSRVSTNARGVPYHIDGAVPTPMEKFANLRAGEARDMGSRLDVVEAKSHI